MHLGRCLAIATSALLINAGARADTLVFNHGRSDPAPRAAWEEVVAGFQAAHPGIEVEVNVFEHEAYKTAIRNWLGSSEPPDVVDWFTGERMNTFVDRGLFMDISDVWEANGLTEAMASTMPSITVDGRQYGVPYSYYQWGIYYRQDLFDQHGVSTPFETIDDLIAACGTLREAGIAPVTIGTRFLWTAAGWFDYLNLRLNGRDFHMALMAGEVSYEDDRVRAVFDVWARLIEADCFIENHTAYSWQEAIPFLVQGEAAMYLIGNFIVPFFPEDQLGNYAFMPFPVINPDVGMYEDAPIDSIHIPTGATNVEAARLFLAFVAQPEQQQTLNDALQQLPPNRNAAVMDDRFLQAGFDMLSNADGIAQFYDRDTNPEMARAGMEGFQEFMANPDRLDRILSQLERTRGRIFR